jgi:large subunit ribosomal protein L4
MRRLALRSALSEKTASESLIVVDRLTVEDARTKTLLGMLGALGVEGKAILVMPEHDEALRRASANLQNVHVALPTGLSLLQLIHSDTVVFSRDAVELVTKLLLGETSANGEAA